MWGLAFAVIDAKRYADDHAGEIVEHRAANPLVPVIAVRVVGSYYGQVLVEPMNPVPAGLARDVRRVTDFPMSAYVRVTIGDSVLCVVPSTLLASGGADRGRYPHTCIFCGAAAYIGCVPAALDCSKRCRP